MLAQAVFAQADKDNNGELTMEEFSFALGDFGMEEEEITELFIKLDTNADGKISMAEFEKLESAMAGDADEEDVVNMTELAAEDGYDPSAPNMTEAQITQLRELFDGMDKDKSGTIDSKEFGTLLASMGEVYSKEELDEYLRELDTNKTGLLEFGEVKRWWARDQVALDEMLP